MLLLYSSKMFVSKQIAKEHCAQRVYVCDIQQFSLLMYDMAYLYVWHDLFVCGQ